MLIVRVHSTGCARGGLGEWESGGGGGFKSDYGLQTQVTSKGEHTGNKLRVTSVTHRVSQERPGWSSHAPPGVSARVSVSHSCSSDASFCCCCCCSMNSAVNAGRRCSQQSRITLFQAIPNRFQAVFFFFPKESIRSEKGQSHKLCATHHCVPVTCRLFASAASS